MFKGWWFTGKQLAIAGPTYVDLSSDTRYSEFDNQVGSFAVFKSATFAITGSWTTAATNNGPIEKLVKVSISHTDTTEDASTLTKSFANSVEAGISVKFVGIELGAETKTNKDTSRALKQLTNNSITNSQEESITVRCPNPNNELVALYQWQMVGVRSTDDVSLTLMDAHYICRYGANSITSPACPPTHCSDAECTTCTGDWEEEEEI